MHCQYNYELYVFVCSFVVRSSPGNPDLIDPVTYARITIANPSELVRVHVFVTSAVVVICHVTLFLQGDRIPQTSNESFEMLFATT
ncbi:unnamed protein product [Strongylus vulgaris]|uniref:Uncharacterized protein n=1 Tax=Strongylus vulgaris TaxID=40348 RepID=A0A3P7J4E2_STRVU|nr:unnamed protein product [Strongylus vulgaris]